MDTRRPSYLEGNVAAWQRNAADYVEAAEAAWAAEPRWGIWQIPDSTVQLLPPDMRGLRAIELGCGTGYVAAWMQRRGAEVVALDPTPNQLATARRLQREHGLDFVLELGCAEALPHPDASFDFAISEYGAALWSDPYRWVPEAARVLRPGGRLVFLSNSPLMVMCAPDYEAEGAVGAELLRPYFGMHETRWPDCPGETEFHLTHGDWISLLRRSGFVIERLVELRAPEGAHTRFPWASAEWARRWPSEDVWVATRSGHR